MFSHNHQISAHQQVRLLVLDLFTGACLFLPMALPRICGESGFFAYLIGIALTWGYGMLISLSYSKSDTVEWLNNAEGFAAKGCRMICIIRCFLSYIFLFGLFTSVLHETFLYTMNKRWIVGGMALVLIYGSTKGLEVRARMAEIFFYIVLIPIFLMGLFALPQAQWSKITLSVDGGFENIIRGALVTWTLMAPVEWVQYLPQKNKRSVIRTVGKAIAIGGLFVGMVYSLCVAVLHVAGMQGENWPTVILMQIMKIPGGFISRQDGLMLCFWIFAMYIGLSGAVNHTINFVKGCSKYQSSPAIFFILFGAGISLITGMKQTFLNVYFYVMIVTGVVWCLILIFRNWVFNRKRPFVKVMGLMCVLILGLSGCENYVELENRDFVMAMGIDSGIQAKYRFTFTFPDLASATGKEGTPKTAPITLEADTLKMAESFYNRMSQNRLDYGQLKVLVFGNEMISSEKRMEEFLSEIKEIPEIARTVYVCKSESHAKDILELDKTLNTSIGLYLEDLFQNQELEVILNDWIWQKDGIMLPEVTIYGKRPGLSLD